MVVESLAGEHDLMEIALAAVSLRTRRRARPCRSGRHARATCARGKVGGRALPTRHTQKKRDTRRGAPLGGAWRGWWPVPHDPSFTSAWDAAPASAGDLVGAITGEAGVTGRTVGSIEIAERHSIVEVAEDVAPDVLRALRGRKIKGKKISVRLE